MRRWRNGAERPEPFVGGTKGSHLVLDHAALMRALNGHMIYFENVDGRVCILFPYLGRVLSAPPISAWTKPGNVRCEDEEVDYILKSLSYVFPGIAVRPDDIVYRYSGVRPLPRSETSFTGRISRDHFVAELPGAPPTLCLVGGKWTTFRAFGAQAADRALEILRMPRTVQTESRQIGGGAGFPADEAGRDACIATLTAEFGVSPARAAHAADHYGSRCRRGARPLSRRQRQAHCVLRIHRSRNSAISSVTSMRARPPTCSSAAPPSQSPATCLPRP